MTYLATQMNATGIVDEDAASLQIVPVSTSNPDFFPYIEKIHFSVYKAAVGGTGICTIQTDHGDVIWKISVDGIKDVVVDWGEVGLRVGGKDANLGIQAVLSGAGTQASVSIGIAGHYDRR